MFSVDNFTIGLQRVFANNLVERKENSIFLSRSGGDGETAQEENTPWGEIPIAEIQNVIDAISEDTTFFECMMYKKIGFEVPIRVNDRMRSVLYLSRILERNQYKVNEHNYEFSVYKASNEYVIALMCFCAVRPELNLDLYQAHRMTDVTIATIGEFAEIFRILTAKIVSPVECTVTEFKRMIQSYLFNISYINNIVFDFADLSEERRPMRRSVRRSGQLFPYKNYKQELVKYYYQGSTTDIAFTQYLAYYHVAEFFFQTIAEQDAFKEIESFITRPSFSPYKTEDIRQFYARIKKRMRDQREDGVWDEKMGLLLCLKKYVNDIDSLKLAIHSIDSTAIEYYKTVSVPFADEGSVINFEDTSEAIYAVIRNRIYSVRNAIVHSKEGERLRYEPFKNDKDLSKEIPLIRAIAEEIIINSAKSMEIRYSE